MRSSNPATAVLRSASRPSTHPHSPSHLQHRPRLLHTTPALAVNSKHRSPYRSISKTELERIAAARAKLLSQYSEEDKAELRRRYTPEQYASIEASEASIDHSHLVNQGQPRQDSLPFDWRDDGTTWTRRAPSIDKHEAKLTTDTVMDRDKDEMRIVEYPSEEATEDSFLRSLGDPSNAVLFAQHAEELRAKGVPESDLYDFEGEPKMPLPRGPESMLLDETQRFINGEKVNISEHVRRVFDDSQTKDVELSSSGSEGEIDDAFDKEILAQPIDAPTPLWPESGRREKAFERALGVPISTFPDVAPDLPKIKTKGVRFSQDDDDDDVPGEDDQTKTAWRRLARVLGEPVRDVTRYRTKLLVSHGVVNQTRLGKIPSQYMMYVAGDEDGRVGIGEGKAFEVNEAARMARLNAIRNMVPIRRYENRTIFGELRGKCGAVELTLNARPPGYGLRCSQHIFEIARCAGISDLQAKVHRSRNPMNVVKAVWEALQNQKDPEEVARARGMKFVDVRKVYYAGLT